LNQATKQKPNSISEIYELFRDSISNTEEGFTNLSYNWIILLRHEDPKSSQVLSQLFDRVYLSNHGQKYETSIKAIELRQDFIILQLFMIMTRYTGVIVSLDKTNLTLTVDVETDGSDEVNSEKNSEGSNK
jgi:hypothetical protein